MPRNVRNWWIECDIDGKTVRFAGGPKSKDGGFHLTIKQRDGGGITTPVRIDGHVADGDSLRLTVNTPEGEIRHASRR